MITRYWQIEEEMEKKEQEERQERVETSAHTSTLVNFDMQILAVDQ